MDKKNLPKIQEVVIIQIRSVTFLDEVFHRNHLDQIMNFSFSINLLRDLKLITTVYNNAALLVLLHFEDTSICQVIFPALYELAKTRMPPLQEAFKTLCYFISSLSLCLYQRHLLPAVVTFL